MCNYYIKGLDVINPIKICITGIHDLMEETKKVSGIDIKTY